MSEQFADNNIPWEEIEKFVLGKMPEEEISAFQNQLKDNPALQKEIQEAKLIIHGIEESALQRKMDSFHEKAQVSGSVSGKQGVVKIKELLRWGIAASVLIIAGIIGYFVFNNKNSNENIYSLYFRPDPGLVSSMGTVNDYNFDRGMIDYKTGKYPEAIKQWNPLFVENKTNDTLQYFIACAQMAINEQQKAIPLLEKVVAKNSVFQNDAYWYLALAWLKQGNREKAIIFAEKSDHTKKDELIKKLK